MEQPLSLQVLFTVFFLYATATLANAQAGAKSSKRGLIYIPPTSGGATSQDDPFIASASDLTWYYNYNAAPTRMLSNGSSAHPLEFVPQLWGAPGTGFADAVKILLDTPGNNVSAVLFMNEPDAGDGGGSGVDPKSAAQIWQDQFVPLKEAHPNLQLGSPAVTAAPSGFTWLAEWFAACDPMCEPDFMAVHYYGAYDGLVTHVQQVQQLFGNVTEKGGLWVTEFAFQGQDLTTSQSFFNQSVAFLDGQDVVKRYSYFGSFTGKESNVGPNAAMLDDDGQLTDIGSWYTGSSATGAKPNSAATETASVVGLSMAFVAAVAFWFL